MPRNIFQQLETRINPEANRVSPEALEQGIGFNGPVPGQSLTNNPDEPRPFEQPPKFTTVKEAALAIFRDMIQPPALEGLIDSVSKGIPLDVIGRMILMRGYQMGMFSPDLMVLLIEPILYMLVAISEKFNLDYLIYEEETEEIDEEATLKNTTNVVNKMKEKAKFGNMRPQQISPEAVPEEIVEGIENLDTTSILERQQQPSAPQTEQSLLAAR